MVWFIQVLFFISIFIFFKQLSFYGKDMLDLIVEEIIHLDGIDFINEQDEEDDDIEYEDLKSMKTMVCLMIAQ